MPPARPAPSASEAAVVMAQASHAGARGRHQARPRRGSDVPRDKEWLFGEMDNGLRYAVRRNGVPPGQVSIRVRIDAGSLYERDSERAAEAEVAREVGDGVR